MASLKLEHIYKVYPNGHKAVSDFNMNIKDGEFIVFVGPSGCGKSTTLRMIAGLEDISSGELYIGDTLVNDMQPKDRDIAMVFQNYALYPHMTVYENMAFGLTLRKVPRAEIHEKVMWAAEVLGLKDYLDRKPKAMSGGQRQRVSLGRAILRNPKVMLLDEPLSNLDAKLRGQMRSMISKLHQQLKTTFIYVTHDQVEAMTLGTRVVVMKLGRVQQIDSPQNLYDHPVNKFVAGFIGTPQMNFFNVTLKEEGDKVQINFSDAEQKPLIISKDAVLKAEHKYLTGDKPIILGFRCENATAEDIKGNENVVDVTVSHFEELGSETLIYGDLKEVGGLGGESKTMIIVKASSRLGYKPGDVIKVKIDVDHIHLFDAESEMTIIPQIPENNVLPVSVKNEKLDLFGTINKPDSINVDFLEKGTITLPLSAFKVGEGNIEGKIVKLEQHEDKHLALAESSGKKFFVFVEEGAKVGDKIKFFVDYSKATFKDENDLVVCQPLVERDNTYATFVNFKTAFQETQNVRFDQIRQEKVAVVEAKYAEIEKQFAEEKANALDAAKKAQDARTGEVDAKQAEMAAEKARLQAELKEAKANYHKEVKEAKAKHKAIFKDEMNKINATYKDIWNKEVADYKELMAKNKDRESRASRRRTHVAFKESFPQMKGNEVERKTNSLEFDKETELNGIKFRFTQKKSEVKETLESTKMNFEKEYFPYDLAVKEYEKKEKELARQKKDDLLRANLLFFFKFDQYYEVIPEEIANKIIQGLGEQVFTKIFRIEVPHNGTVEAPETMKFKVVALVNYGETKFYKCTAEMLGEKVVLYLDKTREINIGDEIFLAPMLDKCQIYEDERNIRLY